MANDLFPSELPHQIDRAQSATHELVNALKAAERAGAADDIVSALVQLRAESEAIGRRLVNLERWIRSPDQPPAA